MNSTQFNLADICWGPVTRRHMIVFPFGGLWLISQETAVSWEDQVGWRGSKDQSRILESLGHACSFCWPAALLATISLAGSGVVLSPPLFLLPCVLGKRRRSPGSRLCRHVQLRDVKIKMDSETYEEWANNESPGSFRERRISESNFSSVRNLDGSMQKTKSTLFLRSVSVSRMLAKPSRPWDQELRVY